MKQRPWEDAAYCCDPVACSAFFVDSQRQFAQVWSAHSGLSPFTSIINQESVPQACIKTSMMEPFLMYVITDLIDCFADVMFKNSLTRASVR